MVWRNGRGGWATIRFLDESFYQHPGDARPALDQVRNFSVGISLDLTDCITSNREEGYMEDLCELLALPDSKIYSILLDENSLDDRDAEMLSVAIRGNNGTLQAVSLLKSRFSEVGLKALVDAAESNTNIVELRLDLNQLSGEMERLRTLASQRECKVGERGLIPLSGSLFSPKRKIVR